MLPLQSKVQPCCGWSQDPPSEGLVQRRAHTQAPAPLLVLVLDVTVVLAPVNRLLVLMPDLVVRMVVVTGWQNVAIGIESRPWLDDLLAKAPGPLKRQRLLVNAWPLAGALQTPFLQKRYAHPDQHAHTQHYIGMIYTRRGH